MGIWGDRLRLKEPENPVSISEVGFFISPLLGMMLGIVLFGK
jgi:hypothetical protein